MLRIGIIGLGPDWDSVYRPALLRLAQRLRVTAVYDSVVPRANRAAEELQAVSVTGIRAVLDRREVRAVLCLDQAWYGLAPLKLAVDHGKPVYVSSELSAPLRSLEQLCRRASDESVLISPELRARTAPVTTRVLELAATRLGPVSRIEADVHATDAMSASAQAVAAVDWCNSLLRSHPVDCRISTGNQGELLLQVAYRRTGPDGAPTSADIRLIFGQPAQTFKAHLVCAHGEIMIHDATHLRWQTASEAADEQLDRDRSDVEVLLDHFARRVVGGLVPVAGLDDVCRTLTLLDPFRSALGSSQKP